MIKFLRGTFKELNLSYRAWSLYFFCCGIIFSLFGGIYKFFTVISNKNTQPLIDSLLPGYWPTTYPGYKRELIVFIVLQFIFILMGILFLWIKKNQHNLTRIKKFFIVPAIFICACAFLIFLSRDIFFRIFYLTASLFFVLSICNLSFLTDFCSSKFKLIFNNSSGYRIGLFLSVNHIQFLLSFLLICILLSPGLKAWSGLVLPNDYYEIPNTFQVNLKNHEKTVMSFDDVENFIEKEQYKRAHPDWYGELVSSFDATNNWTSEAGRILYHHSYIFVPAKNWLTYGFNGGSVPFLYGYGNTIFFSLIMGIWGATLSTYFFVYPLTLVLGLLCMSSLVGYCSGNKRLFLLALLIGLYEMYQVGFTAAILAASFNPLRYLGFILQIGSVFLYLREYKNLKFIYLAAAFSLFWNTEFALFGIISQVLCLLFGGQFKKRLQLVVAIASLLLIPIVFKYLTLPPQENLGAVLLGFFQINMPFLTPNDGVLFIVMSGLFDLILVLLSLKFQGAERIARLCCIPALSFLLTKIIFNPSSPHAAITFTFLIPFTLVYMEQLFSYDRMQPSHNQRSTTIFFSLVLIISGFCWFSGERYKNDSAYMHKYQINSFVSAPWSGLGESIPIATNKSEIEQRVREIRKVMTPNDRVLFLSPFDHLLSFYVNPKNYCGHFELITNLARKDDVKKVVSCVEKFTDVLVVYDKALSTPCPDLIKLGIQNRCPQKLELKENVINLLPQLPNLTIVGKTDNLTFYRNIGAKK